MDKHWYRYNNNDNNNNRNDNNDKSNVGHTKYPMIQSFVRSHSAEITWRSQFLTHDPSTTALDRSEVFIFNCCVWFSPNMVLDTKAKQFQVWSHVDIVPVNPSKTLLSPVRLPFMFSLHIYFSEHCLVWSWENWLGLPHLERLTNVLNTFHRTLISKLFGNATIESLRCLSLLALC